MIHIWMTLLLTVIGGIGYHLSQKMIPAEANPFVILAFTYFFAFIICLFAIFLNRDFVFDKAIYLQSSWIFFVLALSIVFVEVGYILAYRSGAPISTFSLLVMIVTAVLLIMVGLFFFKETISLKKGLGIVLSLIGIYLIIRP